MELTVLNIELGTTITHCFNLSSDTVRHKQPVRMFALKKHFWKNPRLRWTILKAVMTVTNVGSTIYNLRKILFISLWFYEAILKNINQRPALNLQVWKQSMMGNPDGQTISRVLVFVIGREKAACVWSTTDGICQLHQMGNANFITSKVLSSLPPHNLETSNEVALFKDSSPFLDEGQQETHLITPTHFFRLRCSNYYVHYLMRSYCESLKKLQSY